MKPRSCFLCKCVSSDSLIRLTAETDIVLAVNFVTFLLLWQANELPEALQYANKNRKLIKTMIKKRKDATDQSEIVSDDEEFIRPFSILASHEAGVSENSH